MSSGMAETLWGKQFPKGGRDEYIRLDANAAHAIANYLAGEGYGPIRAAAAAGWDAAVSRMAYEDGTPVEVTANVNPYR